MTKVYIVFTPVKLQTCCMVWHNTHMYRIYLLFNTSFYSMSCTCL